MTAITGVKVLKQFYIGVHSIVIRFEASKHLFAILLCVSIGPFLSLYILQAHPRR